MIGHSDRFFGTPASATTLMYSTFVLLISATTLPYSTLILLISATTFLFSASALLLVLLHFCYVVRHVLIDASELLLVLWYSCYLVRHVLICASALLLVLRHSCYVGRHVLIGASALLLCATAFQRCIVSSDTYCAASYSFIMISQVVAPLSRPDPFGRIRTESEMSLKSLKNHIFAEAITKLGKPINI